MKFIEVYTEYQIASRKLLDELAKRDDLSDMQFDVIERYFQAINSEIRRAKLLGGEK